MDSFNVANVSRMDIWMHFVTNEDNMPEDSLVRKLTDVEMGEIAIYMGDKITEANYWDSLAYAVGRVKGALWIKRLQMEMGM